MKERKPIRLKDWDYSQSGEYFLTICAKGHSAIFGRVVGTSIARPPEVVLSPLGRLVRQAVEAIPEHYPSGRVEKAVVMPNHLHLLLRLQPVDGRAMLVPTVAEVVRQMKGYVTKQAGFAVWQGRYHDHIVRDQEDHDRIWTYLEENPAKWTEDIYYTE